MKTLHAFEPKTRHEYAAASRGDQTTFLHAAINFSQAAFAHMLFCCCVSEYRLSPTKTKAVFIWERFLKDIGNWAIFHNPSHLDLGVDECGNAAVLATIKWNIEQIERQIGEAGQMSRFARFQTSAERKPSGGLFDPFIHAMLTRSGDSPWNEFESNGHKATIRSPDMHKMLVSHLPRLRRELHDKGFTMTAAALPHL